jgi:hypothetical protein
MLLAEGLQVAVDAGEELRAGHRAGLAEAAASLDARGGGIPRVLLGGGERPEGLRVLGEDAPHFELGGGARIGRHYPGAPHLAVTAGHGDLEANLTGLRNIYDLHTFFLTD